MTGVAVLRHHVPRQPHGFLPREVLADPAIIRAAIGGASVLGAYFAMLIAAPLLIPWGGRPCRSAPPCCRRRPWGR